MEESVRSKLNRETAKLDWQAVAPFFARGQVIAVQPGTDLIEVGASISEDNIELVKAWQQQSVIFTPSDADALCWHQQNTSFWGCVINPWLLIQASE